MKTIWIVLAVSMLPLVCVAQKPGLPRNAIAPPIGYEMIKSIVAEGEARAWAGTQYRLLNGVTNRLTDPGWVRLDGVVSQNTSAGMIAFVSGERIFIAHPPKAADEQPFTAWAKEMPDLYSYNTVGGSTKTIRKFDCGIPMAAPAPVVYREPAPRQLSDEEKNDLAKRVLKYQTEQADKGLPSFQYLMGKRYLIGDGVTQNVATAKEWFEKSAKQGDSDAKKALAETAGR